MVVACSLVLRHEEEDGNLARLNEAVSVLSLSAPIILELGAD